MPGNVHTFRDRDFEIAINWRAKGDGERIRCEMVYIKRCRGVSSLKHSINGVQHDDMEDSYFAGCCIWLENKGWSCSRGGEL